MKLKDFKMDLQQATTEQLLQKCDELRRDLLVLRLTAATSHVKDNAQFKKLRKNIARALTTLSRKKREDMEFQGRDGDEYDK